MNRVPAAARIALTAREGRVVTKFQAVSRAAGAGGRASSGRARPALSRGFRATAGGGGVVGLMVLVNAPAAAVLLDGEDETKESGESSVSASLPFKMDGKAAALGKTIGLGAVMGYCAGYSMKKVGKVAAVGVGVLFISVQLLAYNGYIKGVDWEAVEADVTSALDTDGDGKLTEADLKAHWQKILRILGYNMPGAGGFAAGAYLGLKQG